MACSINIGTCVSSPLDIDVSTSHLIGIDTNISPQLNIECYAICKPHLSYEDFVLSNGQAFMIVNLQHFKIKKQDDYGIFK